MTDADANDSSQADDEGRPAEDDEEEETEDQNQYGGDDTDIDPVEQTERQDGERNDADESDD